MFPLVTRALWTLAVLQVHRSDKNHSLLYGFCGRLVFCAWLQDLDLNLCTESADFFLSSFFGQWARGRLSLLADARF